MTNLSTSTFRAGRRGMLSVMLAAMLWGTVGAASQGITHLTATNPLSLSFLRLLVAGPLLLVSGWRLLGSRMWSVSRRDFGMMLLMGALVAADQTLYFAAISYTGVTVATLIAVCGAPVLVTLLAALMERQRPTNFTLFSVVLALVGTVLLISASASTPGMYSASLMGIACASGAAAGYAVIILFGRFLAARCHPLQVTAVGFSAGAVLLGIIAQATGFVGFYSVQGWALIVYIGAVPTAFAYGLFLTGARTIPAPVASVLVLLEPLTAAVLAWLFLGESLSVGGIIGSAMLLTAIYMLSTLDSQPQPEPQPQSYESQTNGEVN